MSATFIEEPDKSDERKNIDLTGTRTPLSTRMGEVQAVWLISHICDRYDALHRHLGDWRERMKKWEDYSLENYSARVGTRDKSQPGSNRPDVFSEKNDTLGLAASFWDFFKAQAKNDIFGTRPWLGATPEGRNDVSLAEKIARHCQWKADHSNLEAVLRDAVDMAGWGGTAFVKLRWRTDTESFFKPTPVPINVQTGEPYVNEAGGLIQTAEELERMGVDGADVEWQERETEDALPIYDNIDATLIHYDDIAFDSTAPEIDLWHTDVFTRFRMGVLDAIAEYGLEREQVELLAMALRGEHEVEDAPILMTAGLHGIEDNPPISLVEGYVRCDPFQTGKPIRLHCVFAPDLRALFSVDYLGNVTPGALLPVFPVRIHKRAGRCMGQGWFGKYENTNDAVDRQFNTICKRNEESASVLSGIHPDALAKPSEAQTLTFNPLKPVTLKEGKSLQDFISFAAIPDTNARSVEIMNMVLQMGQMRSGITSAAQGELSGVPSSSTATGVRDLMSRGATLVKEQIDQVVIDLQKPIEFAAHLIYQNHNREETFTYGEGADMETVALQPGDVAGLRINARLTLVQSQNASKLQSSQVAIQILQAWVQVPEAEKTAVRPLFVQAISALGFRNAEDIIRAGQLTDAAGNPVDAMGNPVLAQVAETGAIPQAMPLPAAAVGEQKEAAPIPGAPAMPSREAAPVTPSPVA